MGYSPNGTRPQQPGFMIIGTQNPVSMAGRRRASPALEKRVINIKLPTFRDVLHVAQRLCDHQPSADFRPSSIECVTSAVRQDISQKESIDDDDYVPKHGF